MISNNNDSLISNELTIDPAVQEHMSDTAKWAKFVSIAGFIFSGMIVIGVFVFFNKISDAYPYSTYNSAYKQGLITAALLYLLVAIVWIVTSVFQYRFAVKLQFALAESNQHELEAAMKNLKIYYRICGVITILGLLLGGLGLIGIMVK